MEKHFHFIILLITCIYTNAYSNRLQATYQYNISDYQLVNIELYKNGTFIISKSIAHTSDQLETYYLNFGYYKIVKDELILTDKDDGMVFRFRVIDQKAIKAEKCYRSLINCTFSFVITPPDVNLIKTDSKHRIPKPGGKLKKAKLRFGEYKLYDAGTLVYLQLSSDGSYEYRLNSLLLFKGKFTLYKNELYLYDRCLNYKMTFYADGDKIIDNYIRPGSILEMTR